MKKLAFFDTNILLYTDDSSARHKKAKATELIGEYQRSGHALVSLQVLQEYFAVATRKLKVPPPLTSPLAPNFVFGRHDRARRAIGRGADSL